MVSVDIRPAQRPDLDHILALYADLEMPGDKPSDLAAAENLFARIQHYPNYTIYIAFAGKVIIGAFSLLIMDNLAHGGAPSGIVEDVVVHRNWRGQGVGRQMMQFAMEQCRQAHCYKLTLSSNLQRTAAHRFYEALGFQRHGYSFAMIVDDKTPASPESRSRNS
jgi:GNAT superfamily N-acetyltransferase